MEEEKLYEFTRESSGFVRELSWWDVFIQVISAPAASGILYFSVTTFFSYPGGNIALSYLLGLVLFIPISLLIGTLAGIFPQSGSLYIAVTRITEPALGYLGATLLLLGYCLTIGVISFVVIGIIGSIFVLGGLVNNSNALISIGVVFQRPFPQVIFAILLVLFYWFLILRNILFYRRLINFLFFVPFIVTIALIVFFLTLGSNSIPHFFDVTWGKSSYEKIIQTAMSYGWEFPSFSLTKTIGLLVIVIWAFGGFDAASMLGGEVKNPRTSFLKGYFFGALILGVIYIFLSFSIISKIGYLISAYDFLLNKQPKILSQIIPVTKPSVPFYFLSLFPNKPIGFVISILVLFWFLNTIPPFFRASIDLIYALSNDRFLPEKFSKLSYKTGLPYNAVHLAFILSLLGVVINFLKIEVIISSINFLIWFIYWLYGLAGILLPYRKPEIYQFSFLNFKIFNIPFVSLLGLLVFFEGWIFTFISIAFLDFIVLFTLGLIIFLAISIYLFRVSKNEIMI